VKADLNISAWQSSTKNTRGNATMRSPALRGNRTELGDLHTGTGTVTLASAGKYSAIGAPASAWGTAAGSRSG
jgi:hypothetical protein